MLRHTLSCARNILHCTRHDMTQRELHRHKGQYFFPKYNVKIISGTVAVEFLEYANWVHWNRIVSIPRCDIWRLGKTSVPVCGWREHLKLICISVNVLYSTHGPTVLMAKWTLINNCLILFLTTDDKTIGRIKLITYFHSICYSDLYSSPVSTCSPVTPWHIIITSKGQLLGEHTFMLHIWEW